MTPTARTLTHLRQLGYLAAVVERWLPRIERKADLFGVADVLAVHPRDKAVVLIQATTLGHVADRLKRIKARPELGLLLKAGLAVEVWGWRGRELRRVALRPEDQRAVLVQDVRGRRRRKGERQRELFPDGPEYA